MCLKFIYMGVIQQSMHETKIHDIDDLQKRLMQTCFDFDWNIIDAGWRDHLRSCVHAGGGPLNRCSDIKVHLYDSPEHFMKLSM